MTVNGLSSRAAMHEDMGFLPPRDGNYRDGTCCGIQAAHTSSRIEIRSMRHPPSTIDRWLILTRWQCLRREHHHGEFSHTTDDEDQ